MTHEDPLFELCRALPGVTEDVEWGDNLAHVMVAAKLPKRVRDALSV